MHCYASVGERKPLPTGRRSARAFALVHTKTSAWNIFLAVKENTSGTCCLNVLCVVTNFNN